MLRHADKYVAGKIKLTATMVSMHISIKQAADTYGVSDRTIRRYIAAGLLTAHRVGPRLIRLDAEQVREQLVGPVGNDAA